MLQLLVLFNDCIALLELCLVGFDLVRGQGHSTKAVKQWHDILCRQLVLSQTQELKRAVLLENARELLHDGTAEVVVGDVEHFQVSVHRQVGVWLQSKHHVLQVFVFEPAGSQEDDLQFLAFGDELGKEADLFRLVLSRCLHLVQLVRAGWH